MLFPLRLLTQYKKSRNQIMLRATPILFKNTPKSVTQTVKDAAWVSSLPFLGHKILLYWLTILTRSYVSEAVQGGGATASKEANKAAVTSEHTSASTKLGAAKDAVGDKMKEVKHDASAEVHKEKAKNWAAITTCIARPFSRHESKWYAA